jgi:hypothetical protein
MKQTVCDHFTGLNVVHKQCQEAYKNFLHLRFWHYDIIKIPISLEIMYTVTGVVIFISGLPLALSIVTTLLLVF